MKRTAGLILAPEGDEVGVEVLWKLTLNGGENDEYDDDDDGSDDDDDDGGDKEMGCGYPKASFL